MTARVRRLLAVTLLAWVPLAGAEEYRDDFAVAYSLGTTLRAPSLSTSGSLGGPWRVGLQCAAQGDALVLLVGIGVAQREGTVRPYAAFLLGPALGHDGLLVLAPQIGLDLMLSPRVALRVGGDVMTVREKEVPIAPPFCPAPCRGPMRSRTTAAALRAGIALSFGRVTTHAGR